MHPSFLSPLSPTIYCMDLQLLQLGKRIDFSPCISDLRELSAAHPSQSRTRHTRVWPTRLDTNAPVITPALYMTPRAPRRPARPLVPFHTPTNSAHLRC